MRVANKAEDKRLLETSGGLWYNINKEGADGGDRRLLPFVPFIRL